MIEPKCATAEKVTSESDSQEDSSRAMRTLLATFPDRKHLRSRINQYDGEMLRRTITMKSEEKEENSHQSASLISSNESSRSTAEESKCEAKRSEENAYSSCSEPVLAQQSPLKDVHYGRSKYGETRYSRVEDASDSKFLLTHKSTLGKVRCDEDASNECEEKIASKVNLVSELETEATSKEDASNECEEKIASKVTLASELETEATSKEEKCPKSKLIEHKKKKRRIIHNSSISKTLSKSREEEDYDSKDQPQQKEEETSDVTGTLHETIVTENTDKKTVDDNIYKQALASGAVPINRYRVMVVGQDGAGKSCLIDSFLNRPFKAQNPSTDGAAIHVAVTAAEGKAGQHAWNEEEYEKAKHLDKYLAAGYVITKRKHQHQKKMEPEQCYEKAATKKERAGVAYTNSFPATREQDRHIEEITKDEKLTPEQQEMIAKYLQSSDALASLENFEVSSKLLWDLGGQERYLTSHAALMPVESKYTVCVYILVIDISKPLGDKAQSSYRPGGTSANVPLELLNIGYNRDFPRHWFTSIGISHPSCNSSPYLGEDLGVRYPAVLIAATHIDKVAKMPNFEEFLKSQNDELGKLICGLKCQDHTVKNPENGQWFFLVNNTKSGRMEDSERCEGVQTIISILDSASKHYWSQKNEKSPMPVAWVRFELLVVSWKVGKIISVGTATKIAYRVGIKSEEEALLALKFLDSLGVIFYFWDVPELADVVVVDPKWLISTVAAFVTAKEPAKLMHKRTWEKLRETGEFSKDMVMETLTEAKVDAKEQRIVLHVLRTLDIICDLPEASSSTFFIPCMISRMLTGTLVWEKYDPSEAFPPPIVIYPSDVQTIPEAFFFRLVTKCTREFPHGCDLSRTRCHFRVGNNLLLELLSYNKGACFIISMNWGGDEDEAVSSVPERAPGIQQFVIDSVANAKKRGMSGLTLNYYYQVSECIKIPESALRCQPPDENGLVRLTDGCEPGSATPALYKSKEYIKKDHLNLVHRWYKKKVRATDLISASHFNE